MKVKVNELLGKPFLEKAICEYNTDEEDTLPSIGDILIIGEYKPSVEWEKNLVHTEFEVVQRKFQIIGNASGKLYQGKPTLMVKRL
ncbi:MAG: hypothetical protein M0P71_01775 [Melioribacteraceae bacterium]|nr:hypothetical protein [Melioribacteraceae bacterium]